ncbi:hypothetical protein Kpol_541p51 [Vanderwaltozyma polyspora DSM 70294]|uniref:Meiotic nuclear division protein 1 n=1 Tax=Vanderwaltozyma polyspora (strain ATCC 22028 / DSM 70294 / BCRC 21397 / CBS 2163 / NBRC 10782 / NRRL Y-8283 / UCD 57-17) TaxID=436907 RepID=A7TIZ6_VANPO|nr:uncharacterized protein Kpol_541p51 [Vanderwaltozyma polyspora DSM 70294]EDO17808.1 hypothetical protein Kpol_541p51 [Vanderwaltozyma polyspora DSM 70294]
MKELEKIIPKKCAGVSPMIVKDLTQQMIDEDGVISVEKCGSTNIYWCFKNQIVRKMFDSCNKIQSDIDSKSNSIKDIESQLKQTLANDRSPTFIANGKSYNRVEQLSNKRQLDEELKILQEKYKNLSNVKWDKFTYQERKTELVKQNNKLNLITDNIELLISYLNKKYFIDPQQIRSEYEIPQEFMEFTNEISSL